MWCLCAAAAAAAAGSTPFLSWVTNTVLANQTLMLAGSGLGGCTEVVLVSEAPDRESAGSRADNPVNLLLPVAASSESSLMAVLPPGSPQGVFNVSARCASGASNSLRLNGPRIFWAQGDCGRNATVGGTIRVYGEALHVPHVNQPHTLLPPTLRLRLAGSRNGEDVSIVANGAQADTHASANQALFQLPLSLLPGEYTVEVANGWAAVFVPMDTFLSGAEPHTQTIQVQSKFGQQASTDPRAFVGTGCYAVPPAVVAIQPPKSSRMPPPRVIVNGQNVATPVDSSFLLRDAITKVAAAGGGTVYLERGQYFIDKNFDVPPNVYLRGASTATVTLFLKEGNSSGSNEDHIRYDYVFKGAGTWPQTWGVSDLTVYATSFYGSIFVDGDVNCTNGPAALDGSGDAWGCFPAAVGFTLQRVRVRGAAYFAWEGPNRSYRPRPNVDFNFTQNDVGAVVSLTGQNFVVEDCDILGAGQIFTQPSSFGGLNGASWGRISRNSVQHGAGAVFMNAWKQVIVEDNVIQAGSLYAGGNILATYNGGYQQHVALLNNTLAGIWGGDREVMTNDGPGAAYFGPLASVSSPTSTIRTARPRIPVNRSKGCVTDKCGWPTTGGFLLVLNGTGAGQLRRVVQEPAQGSTWVLDAPLGPVDFGADGSYVQIAPFRGRNIFHRNTFRDVGCFQIWGTGLDTIVDGNYYDRAAGMISWGQWRGYAEPDTGSSGLNAITGEGAQPAWFNIFSDNTMAEPGVVNYATSDSFGGFDFGRGYTVGALNGAEYDSSTSTSPPGVATNAFTTFRGNQILANGGILIAGDSSNMVVEFNTIEYPGGYRGSDDDLGICVENSTTKTIFVRANDAPVLFNATCGLL